MKSAKKILFYSNLILMILSVVYSILLSLGILITAGWSSDTSVMFETIKFYALSIIIVILCIILYCIHKNRHMIFIGNTITSMLYIIAEYYINKNPYATRQQWAIIVIMLPFVLATAGEIMHLLKSKQ